MTSVLDPTAATTPKRQCRASNSAGLPCRSPTVGEDGLCSMHSGRFDPRELGRRGGLATWRKREEQAQHVRERLRRRVDRDFERVWSALSAGLDAEDVGVKSRTAAVLLSHAFGSPAAAIVEGKDGEPSTIILESAFRGSGNGDGS